jgi:ABC-type proline/glycine betaine transport system substrate-binding protein
METEAAFKTIATENTEQTLKVLDALSNLTDWMNTLHQIIDNIDTRLKCTEKTGNYRDAESEFYVTKRDFNQGLKDLHKFTEEYCNDATQQRDFYN